MIDFDSDMSILQATLPLGDGVVGIMFPGGQGLRIEADQLSSLQGKLAWCSYVRDEWARIQDSPPPKKKVELPPPVEEVVAAGAAEFDPGDPVAHARRSYDSWADRVAQLTADLDAVTIDMKEAKGQLKKWETVLKALGEEIP